MSAAVVEDGLPMPPPSRPGEPTWAVALLYPPQGHWTEKDYLDLETNKLVELANGYLEILPMPTIFHQGIVKFLFLLFNQFVQTNASGEVFFAPLRVRLFPDTFREPDVVYLRPERIGDRRRPPRGADLAIEVVSDGEESRRRDLVTKPEEYARAGINEYWIVDPQERRITVLTLDGSIYRVHGEFTEGTQATSVLLPGFVVDVSEALAPGENPPV